MKRNAKSFTLIEIILVIVLIAVVLGLSITQFDNFIPKYRLRRHVNQVRDYIEMAYSKAAIEGKSISLRFDEHERKTILEYYIPLEEEESDLQLELSVEEENAVEEEEDLVILEKEWERDVELDEFLVHLLDDEEEERDFIVFSPMGHCDGATIKFVLGEEDPYEIEIWSLTGMVEVNELKSDF